MPRLAHITILRIALDFYLLFPISEGLPKRKALLAGVIFSAMICAMTPCRIYVEQIKVFAGTDAHIVSERIAEKSTKSGRCTVAPEKTQAEYVLGGSGYVSELQGGAGVDGARAATPGSAPLEVEMKSTAGTVVCKDRVYARTFKGKPWNSMADEAAAAVLKFIEKGAGK